MSPLSAVIGTRPIETPISKIRSCQPKRYWRTALSRRSPSSRASGRRGVLEQHAELVAAQAGQGVGLAQQRAQERGHLLEHLVAGEVAAGVVDHLELVEVEIEEGVLAAVLGGGVEAVLEALLELPAVDQAGERVVAREVDHLALHAAELGDVLEDQDAAGGAPLAVLDRRHRVADGELPAVAPHQHRVAGVLDHPPLGEAALDGVGQRPCRSPRRRR